MVGWGRCEAGPAPIAGSPIVAGQGECAGQIGPKLLRSGGLPQGAPCRRTRRRTQLLGRSAPQDGDVLGAAAWRRVAPAIEELRRKRRKGSRRIDLRPLDSL